MASDSQTKSKHRTTAQTLKNMTRNLFWISQFVFLAYYFNLSEAIVNNSHTNSFYISIIALLLFLGCFIYISVYLPLVCNIKPDFNNWETSSSF
jgi:hypothetical protein